MSPFQFEIFLNNSSTEDIIRFSTQYIPKNELKFLLKSDLIKRVKRKKINNCDSLTISDFNVPLNALLDRLKALEDSVQFEIMDMQLNADIKTVINKINNVVKIAMKKNKPNSIEDLIYRYNLINDMLYENPTLEIEIRKNKLAEIIYKEIEQSIFKKKIIYNMNIDTNNQNFIFFSVGERSVSFALNIGGEDSFNSQIFFKKNALQFDKKYYFLYVKNKIINLTDELSEEMINEVFYFGKGLHQFTISDWDSNEFVGLMNEEGIQLIEPRYSEFEFVNDNYIKGFRINPLEEVDEMGNIIEEKWILFDINGNEITIDGDYYNVLSFDKKNKLVEVETKDGKIKDLNIIPAF